MRGGERGDCGVLGGFGEADPEAGDAEAGGEDGDRGPVSAKPMNAIAKLAAPRVSTRMLPCLSLSRPAGMLVMVATAL